MTRGGQGSGGEGRGSSRRCHRYRCRACCSPAARRREVLCRSWREQLSPGLSRPRLPQQQPLTSIPTLALPAPRDSAGRPWPARSPIRTTPEQALLARSGPGAPHDHPLSLQLVVAGASNSPAGDDSAKKRPHQGPEPALTLEQKRAICEKASLEPDLKQEELAQWAVHTFNLRSLARNTVANVLKDWQRWNTSVACGYSGAKRIRPGAHPELEAALKLFVDTQASLNEHVKLPQLRDKVRDLAFTMELKNFKYSSGWMDRMRKRQNILISVRRQRQAELEQPDLQLAQELVVAAARQLGIDPTHVYNFDEQGFSTGRSRPSPTSPRARRVQAPRHGPHHCGLHLQLGWDGGVQAGGGGPPNVPGSFGAAFDPTKHVQYYSGPNARMTSAIFNAWLQSLDVSMQQKERKVGILVDSAACHRVTLLGATELALGPLKGVRLASGAVTLIYLPPTAPPSWQPLERGILQSFKTRYRRRLMEWTLARWERQRAQAKPGGLTALTQYTFPGSQLAPGASQGRAQQQRRGAGGGAAHPAVAPGRCDVDRRHLG